MYSFYWIFFSVKYNVILCILGYSLFLSVLIGIDNHSIVYSACEQIRANWEDLATRLSVPRPSVEAIRADGKDSADCLRKLLDEWLKRSAPEQPLPSWRGLCDALTHLDRSLSERISDQHQCGCSLCTGVIAKISFYFPCMFVDDFIHYCKYLDLFQ